MTTPRIGGEILVNASTATAQSQPTLTTLAGGDFVVAWTDDSQNGVDSNGGAIRFQIYNSDGSHLGSEMVGGSADGSVSAPWVVGMSDGRFALAWSSYALFTAPFILARLFNADGSPSSGQLTLATAPSDGQIHLDGIAASPDGGFATVYQSFQIVGGAQDYREKFQTFDPDGNPVGAGHEFHWAVGGIGGDTGNQVSGAGATALSNGQYVFAWTQRQLTRDPPFFPPEPHVEYYAADGSLVGTAHPVSDASVWTVLADGRYFAVFVTGSSAVQATIFHPDNSNFSIPFQANPPTGSDPAVAALADGRFVVAWVDSNTLGDASGKAIHAQVYNINGSTSGAEFLVNTTTAGDQTDPTIAALADGGFVVAWTDASQTGGDTSGTAIRAQVFGQPDGIVQGTASAETLVGDNAVNDTINGLGGGDTVFGLGGGDVITGGGGDDTIDGGGGNDWALFSGVRSEYDIRTFADGAMLKTIVTHQGGTQADGSDALTGVEGLDFANHTFNLARAQLNHVSNVDGDRFDDVLFQNATTGQVYFAKMADGAFQSWGLDTAALGADWKAIGSGDVNPGPAGGAETFVQQQSSGTIYYASLDTGAIAWGVVDVAPGLDWKLRAVADMNGDATADAVLQNATTGAIKYAAMFNGQFAGYDIVSQNLTPDWLLVGAGDINRDGLADAVIQQQSTGTIYYAVMANGAFQSWGVVSQNLTPDWRVKAVADVNSIGFANVIVQQASTGTTYFTDMHSGPANGWGVVTANVTADWMVQGAADVDNDGFADVLFQNPTGSGGVNPGTAYYAGMGPAGFEGWGDVASNISSDWHVV